MARPSYRMAPVESAKVKVQIDRLLDLGLIEPSVCPFATPVLIVKHKSGKLRMCIDYRGLNVITIKNRF